MDRITESMMKTFCEETGTTGSESERFERFAAYCVVGPRAFEGFDVEELMVGDDSTPGLDGLAVLVNGQVVADKDELSGILAVGGHLEVRLVFIQAKTSPNFQGKVMLDLADEAQKFFTRDLEDLHVNLRDFRELVDQLLSLGVRLKQNPECTLAYATTGRLQDDSNLTGKARSAEKTLSDLNNFSKVTAEYVDASALQEAYRSTKQRVSAQFHFASRTTVNSVQGISQAYLGIIPATEFLRIVTDAQGELRGGIFEGNVRDFQGSDNKVNRAMQETLEKSPDRFVIQNNGVTVVAKTGAVVGDQFTIEDFQVVNGCQSANVLYEARDSARFAEAAVSLRVVITESDEIANSITAATNSQTPVREEELFALLAFQRRLEHFFLTYSSPKDLYFERRSRQYQSTSVPKSRVVTRAQMVKAYASTWFGVPHRATGYYTSLYSPTAGGKLFDEGQAMEGYYSAAVAAARLEALLKTDQFVAMRPARYQLLHAARHLSVGGGPMPLNSKKHEKAAAAYADVLWDTSKSLALFLAASAVIKAVAGDDAIDRDFTKRQTVTNNVAARCAIVRSDGDASWLVDV